MKFVFLGNRKVKEIAVSDQGKAVKMMRKEKT